MATITSLSALAKTSVTANDYLLTANAVTPANNKFLLQDLFPIVNTLGTSSESLFVNITSKNTLNFKGIRSLNAILTVATASNNITLQVNEASINLANCNNATAGFLTSVNLASAAATGILPVTKGGTGLSTLGTDSFFYANNVGAVTPLAFGTNGQLIIGRTGLAPVMANLTAGANITITNGSGTITIAASVATLSNALNASTYNIYGFGWLGGDSGNRGIKVNTSGQTFIGSGAPTPFFTGDLNVSNSIYVNGNIAQTIGAVLTAVAAPGPLTIKAADANAANVGGTLNVRAGASQGSTVLGGDLNLYPGNHDGTGGSGDVNIWGYSAAAAAQSVIKIKGQSRYVGITNPSPVTPLDVKQDQSIANTPVVRLEQLDTDESFINFVGTSSAASANSISSSSASAGAKTGAIRVKINGVDAWIRVYATAE
jgi:hypothetical protein